jgi:hypothetical protein
MPQQTLHIFLRYITVAYIMSGQYIKYHSRLTSLCVLHVVITDCGQLKSMRLGEPSSGIPFKPNVKIDRPVPDLNGTQTQSAW